jgi:glycosyltransferase 2 family protein
MHTIIKILQSWRRWLMSGRLNGLINGLIISAVLFFLGQTVWRHWQTIVAVQLTAMAVQELSIALLISLFAHVTAGCVWSRILRALGRSASLRWGVRTYLTTNLAKYLPGNVWHFYGRFNACKQRQIAGGIALASILLEPVLMLAAALLIVIVLMPWSGWTNAVAAGVLTSGAVTAGVLTSGTVTINATTTNALSLGLLPGLAIVGLAIVLISIHPKNLNRLLQKIGKAKRQRLAIAPQDIPQIQGYLWQPLWGEIGFLSLRASGFVLTWHSVHMIEIAQLPSIYSSFSLAWLLGLVIPGLPGGIGVFEAVMLGLLNQQLPAGELLVVVGLYRLVNTLAEAIGAGLAVITAARSPRLGV